MTYRHMWTSARAESYFWLIYCSFLGFIFYHVYHIKCRQRCVWFVKQFTSSVDIAVVLASQWAGSDGVKKTVDSLSIGRQRRQQHDTVLEVLKLALNVRRHWSSWIARAAVNETIHRSLSAPRCYNATRAVAAFTGSGNLYSQVSDTRQAPLCVGRYACTTEINRRPQTRPGSLGEISVIISDTFVVSQWKLSCAQFTLVQLLNKYVLLAVAILCLIQFRHRSSKMLTFLTNIFITWNDQCCQ